MFHCMRRWKRSISPPKLQLHKSPQQFLFRTSASKPTCLDLLTLVVGNIKRAIYRKAGLVSLRHLLALVSFSSIQADILEPLPSCLRDNPATRGSVRTHLEAVSPKLTGSVWKAFCSLYRMFSAILLESKLTLETSTLADAHLVKLVLESNGVNYEKEDCAALPSIGIFNALEKVLQRLRDCLQAAASMPQAVNSECVALVERCHAAAWNLFQLLSVQIVDSNPAPAEVASVFAVYYRIVLHALADVSPKSAAAIRDREANGKGSGDAAAKNELDLPSLVREELLGRPRWFVHHEEGFTASEKSQEISTADSSKGFTLSFWMFLNQTTTAHDRTVLLRSYGITRVAPLIVLCGSDNALELRMMVDSGQVQKYRSQGSISSYKWTQVGVSAHDDRIDIYINAVLDSSHRVVGAIPERNASEPSMCYVGCVAAEVRAQHPSMDVPASGIKGWVSRVQLHTQPLTLTHARALLDLGAPPLLKPRDGGEKICSLLVLLARSDIGKNFLRRPAWLRLMFNFFSATSPQLQITTLRILYYILPDLTPEYLDELELSQLLRQPHQLVGMKSSLAHLLVVTGASLWQAPTNLHGGFDDPMDDSRHSLSALSSSLLLLLQRLATAKNWTNAVRRVLHTALTSLFDHFAGPALETKESGSGFAGVCDLDTLRTGVAALCVLGGHPANIILDDPTTVREATVIQMLVPLGKWAPQEREEQELVEKLKGDIIHLLRQFLLQTYDENADDGSIEAHKRGKGGQLKSRAVRVMSLLVGQPQWLSIMFEVCVLFCVAHRSFVRPLI